MDNITFKAIGLIYSQFKHAVGTPIQPTAAASSNGRIVIFDEYSEGLKDLEDFSHIFLIYHFNYLDKGFSPIVKPFLDNKKHGVFSTRAPNRPNPIGLSIVKLHSIEKNTLYISDIDIINKTPLLDIKPYVPEFDGREDCKIGWLNGNINKLKKAKDDGRFI